MKAYVIAIFDTHSGHKLGLCNPTTKIIEQGPRGELKWVPVNLNAYQKYLWYDIYIPAVQRVKEITKDNKIISLWGGDILHGNKYPEQVATPSEYNQVLMAIGIVRPVLDLPNCITMRSAAGTGAHDFTEHSGTLLVCEMLRKVYPNVDIQANYQGEAEVMGYTIDYAHHGPGEGIRIWLNGNNVRYYLADLMMRELSLDKRPPDLVLRGHVHGKNDETFEMGNYKSRILIIPSMCGMSFHGRKVTKSRSIVTNGFALFEITDGKLTNHWKFYREDDCRTKEKLL